METVRGWAAVVQHTQTSYLEPIMFGGVARSLSKNPLKTIRGMGGFKDVTCQTSSSAENCGHALGTQKLTDRQIRFYIR